MTPECSFVDDHRVKSIPYPPEIGAVSHNVGFIDVKAKPDLIDSLHEIEGLPNLKKLLSYFSGESSPFFSIGCGRWINQQSDGRYFSRVYVEFAFNYPKIAHRVNYYSLFEAFTADAKTAKIGTFSRCEWRVSPISLTSQRFMISSCTIWIHLVDQPTPAAALKACDKSFLLLDRYFRSLKVQHGSGLPIFGPSLAAQIVPD